MSTSKASNDFEARLADLERRFAKLEKPEHAELVARRYAELHQLVQYISVMAKRDVLADILANLRAAKTDIERQISAVADGDRGSAAAGAREAEAEAEAADLPAQGVQSMRAPSIAERA